MGQARELRGEARVRRGCGPSDSGWKGAAIAEGLLMFITDLATADALPVLEKSLRFAGARQRIISHNIANLSTPEFQPTEAPVAPFRAALAEAVEARREKWDGVRGEMRLKSSRGIREDGRGGFEIDPQPLERNILFHDRNNRSLEHQMQDLVENAGAYRVAADLLRSRMDVLRSAISESV
jgi:flagellar basal-body rod protein FlgB